MSRQDINIMFRKYIPGNQLNKLVQHSFVQVSTSQILDEQGRECVSSYVKNLISKVQESTSQKSVQGTRNKTRESSYVILAMRERDTPAGLGSSIRESSDLCRYYKETIGIC